METFRPKRILCPTDFSEPATLALRYGKELAGCFDADLLVLYAEPFTPPPYFTARQIDRLMKEAELSKKKAHKSLKAYVRNRVSTDGPLSATDQAPTVGRISPHPKIQGAPS